MDDDVLADAEPALVFIACNVSEARRAEELLTASGVDYALSFETFVRSGPLASLFGASENVGVGLSVAPDRAAACRDLLHRHGLRSGIVDEG